MSAINTNTYKHNTLSISCGGRIKIGISLKKTSQELDSQPIAVAESILHVFQEQKLCQQKLVQFVRPPKGYKMVPVLSLLGGSAFSVAESRVNILRARAPASLWFASPNDERWDEHPRGPRPWTRNGCPGKVAFSGRKCLELLML